VEPLPLPWTWTGWARTRRAVRVLERMLAERWLTVLLSGRRAAREGALLRRRVLRRRRVLLVSVLLVSVPLASLLLVSLLRGAVPRPGRSARGHARFLAAVAGPAVAFTGETRWVSAGCAASGSAGEGGTPLRVGGSGESGCWSPPGTGCAALATVLPRAGAAVWPGVRVRLPAPPPRKRSHGNDRKQLRERRHPARCNRTPPRPPPLACPTCQLRLCGGPAENANRT
jgi:hypothetical protein